MPLDDTHHERLAFTLRMIAEQMHIEPIKQIMRQPTLKALYRVTIHYHDLRALDVVATLLRRGATEATLTLHYDGLTHLKPIIYEMSLERYNGFALALQKLHFDKLKDQPRLPQYGADIWMVERAASTYIHGLLLSPQTADGDYRELVSVIETHLPEILKEVH